VYRLSGLESNRIESNRIRFEKEFKPNDERSKNLNIRAFLSGRFALLTLEKVCIFTAIKKEREREKKDKTLVRSSCKH